MSYDYFFDIAYKMYYKSGLDETNEALETDAIGFNLHSVARTQFYFTFFDIFLFDFKVEITPIQFTPVDMSLTYTRLAGLLHGEPFSLVFDSEHDFVIMDIKTTWRKDIRLPHVSLFDLTDGGNILDDVVYPKLKESENDAFEDSLLSIDLFDYFVAQNYPEYTKWYGRGKYCDFDFLNDW